MSREKKGRVGCPTVCGIGRHSSPLAVRRRISGQCLCPRRSCSNDFRSRHRRRFRRSWRDRAVRHCSSTRIRPHDQLQGTHMEESNRRRRLRQCYSTPNSSQGSRGCLQVATAESAAAQMAVAARVRAAAARAAAWAAGARARAAEATAVVTLEGRNPYNPYRMGKNRTLHLHRRPGSCHRLRHYTC